jgi:general secretion pathway protein E/type IV pilus assembly protein PilB
VRGVGLQERDQLQVAAIGKTDQRVVGRALGMRTMREDGLRKVLAGITTIEEVVSITVGDAS